MKLFNKKSEQQLSSNKETDLAKTSSVNPELQKTQSLKLPNLKYSHKETAGRYTHQLLSLTLPISVYLLVSKFGLPWLALVIILFSKWQIFLVKPRFWWANLKFSAVDLVFKLSISSLTIFAQFKIESLVNKSSISLHILQLSLVGLYIFWNLYLRTKTAPLKMLTQSLLSQYFGLTALAWASGFISPVLPVPVVISIAWLISYASAQHALYAYEESAIPQLASFWALTSTLLFFMQIIWAQNFLFFQGLIYLPLLPGVSTGLGILAARSHALIEDQQSSKDISKAQLERSRTALIQQGTIAAVISLILSILIIIK